MDMVVGHRLCGGHNGNTSVSGNSVLGRLLGWLGSRTAIEGEADNVLDCSRDLCVDDHIWNVSGCEVFHMTFATVIGVIVIFLLGCVIGAVLVVVNDL